MHLRRVLGFLVGLVVFGGGMLLLTGYEGAGASPAAPTGITVGSAVPAVVAPLTLTVDSPLDRPDAHPGDGICDDGTGHCTLRAAIDETNHWPTTSTNVITLTVDPTLTIAPTGNDDINSGDLNVTDKVAIFGANHTLDANGLDRAFHQQIGKLNLSSLVIQGGVAGGSTPLGGAIYSQGFLNLNHTTVWFNRASGNDAAGGGIYGSAQSTITVNQSGFFHNGASGIFQHDLRGGAIATTGKLTVTASTIRDNNTFTNSFTDGAGGGLWLGGTDATIASSTIAGNLTTCAGGGVDVAAGSARITDSTLDDDTATSNGAGCGGNELTASGGTGTIVASTIASSAPSGGAALVGSNITASGTIVDATGVAACGPSIGSGGFNIVSDATCGISGTHDRSSVDPLLHALAQNGGPTLTLLPFKDSPAVDTIPVGTSGLCDVTTPPDQRGVARPQGPACNVGSVEGQSAGAAHLVLTVNSPLDGPDAHPGDGVCADGTGHCTLRAAITETNDSAFPATIDIAAGVSPELTIAGAGEDANATGDLDSTNTLIINGNGAILDANGIDRAIHQLAGTLTVNRLTIINGTTAGDHGAGGLDDGGGILADGALNLNHVTIQDNQAVRTDVGAGGGIAVHGALTVVDSTIAGNTANSNGGGIFADGPSTSITGTTVSGNQSLVMDPDVNGDRSSAAVTIGTTDADAGPVFISDSTISDNQSEMNDQAASGGGLLLYSTNSVVTNTTVTGNNSRVFPGEGFGGVGGGTGISFRNGIDLESDTITDNTGWPGVYALLPTAGNGPRTIGGSIITGPSPVCNGPLYTSNGFNIVSDATCGLTAGGDQPSTDPMLSALADHGGPTQTQLPLAGSPAIDAIPVGTAGLCDGSRPTDQRGAARPGGPACDIGAVEANGLQPGSLSLTVDSATDADDVSPGDGICDDGTGHCTLRAAITETNQRTGPNTITIAPGVDPTITLPFTLDQSNADGDFDVFTPLTIHGNGATIDANGQRGFTLEGGPVSMDHLSIINGTIAGFEPFVGGGIRADADLTLNTVTMSNDAAALDGAGGGVFTTARLTVVDSTFTGNNADGPGSSIDANGPATTITDSTFSGGHAGGNEGGGEIANADDGAAVTINGGTVAISGTTISGNVGLVQGSGEAAGGLLLDGTNATVTNTTISDNSVFTIDVLTTDGGAGVAVRGGSVGLVDDTIAGNSASASDAPNAPPDLAGPTISGGDAITMAGTIVSAPPGVACSDPVTSKGFNIVTDDTCGVTSTGDHQSTDPMLADLLDNGGPTQTQLPARTSPAIDAVPVGTVGLCDGSVATDQRGIARPQGPACDIGAVEVVPLPGGPLSLTVDSAVDADDANPGDGICNDGTNHCTLRAAITEANQHAGPDTITIAPGIDPTLDLLGESDDSTNSADDLNILDPLTIHGNGATLDAGHLDRAIDVGVGPVSIDDLTITNGSTDGDNGPGGAIESEGDLTLDHVTITGNEEFKGNAAGVAATGNLTIVDSTISNNQNEEPFGSGASAILASGSSTTITDSTISGNISSPEDDILVLDSPAVSITGGHASISGSTISGNTTTVDNSDDFTNGAGAAGGLLLADTTATVTNTTVTDNQRFTFSGTTVGGVGITVRGGSARLTDDTLADNQGNPTDPTLDGGTAITLAGTIVSAPSPEPACSAPVTSGGFNLVSDATCGVTSTGDRQSTDALLGALADNGGPTQTILPGTGSPALDGVPVGTAGLCDGTIPTDQRGVNRPQGLACDIGAVEQ